MFMTRDKANAPVLLVGNIQRRRFLVSFNRQIFLEIAAG